MPKTPKPQVPPEETPERAEATPSELKREEVIRAGVLKALGRPAELLKVSVAPLWDDYFRVNVVTGTEATAVRIPDSFFVTADAQGRIVQAEPPIQKTY